MITLPRPGVPNLLTPDGYHGGGRRTGHFEGWYVKSVSADRTARLAVIPGVFRSVDPLGPHEAFVQVLDGATGRSWYVGYPLSAFHAAADRFDVRIGPNRFSAEGFELDLPEPRLHGRVDFTSPLDPWPVTPLSPGAMGWYAYIPAMECYHGVTSFGHSLGGQLTLEGERLDFAAGRGYIEKDWGRAFPSGYLWLHSNHFSDPTVSLMGSLALIPWMHGQFRGVLIGLKVGDQLHRFATYTRARTKAIGIDDSRVRWTVRSRDGLRLDLSARRTAGGMLHAPVRSHMHRRVEETLDARIEVRLTDPAGAVLLDDVGEVGGLEVHGDIGRLLTTADRGAKMRR